MAKSSKGVTTPKAASSRTRQRRAERCITWVALGRTAKDIMAMYQEEYGHKMSLATAQQTVEDCMELIRIEGQAKRRDARDISIARHDRMFRHAMEIGEVGEALQVQKNLDKILGVDKPPSVEELEKLVKIRERLAKGLPNSVRSSAGQVKSTAAEREEKERVAEFQRQAAENPREALRLLSGRGEKTA